MSALEEDGQLVPRMKFSDNPEKLTLPGRKELYRVYDAQGMAFADLITLSGERIDTTQPLTLFDPNEVWKRTTMTDYSLKQILQPFCREGQIVAPQQTLQQISAYRAQEERTIWEEQLRPLNPQPHKVDLSQPLWDLRDQLLHSDGWKGNA